ncbi:hypothetical protein LSUE1_G008650, partial [Lachnellula suecica]
MTAPKITLAPATLQDFYTLATLENRVFWDDNFSNIAFGPDRGSPENIQLRAASLEASLTKEGQSWRYVKAVDGSGTVVGWAGWGVVTQEGKEKEVVKKEMEEVQMGRGWGVGAD